MFPFFFQNHPLHKICLGPFVDAKKNLMVMFVVYLPFINNNAEMSNHSHILANHHSTYLSVNGNCAVKGSIKKQNMHRIHYNYSAL